MFDVVTFGSATRDIFLRLKKENYRILEEREAQEGRSLCFPFGAKVFISEVKVFSGGGATNSAATFSNQGLKVAVCSKVGRDKEGEGIIAEMEKFKVKTKFIKRDKNYPTAHSFILSSADQDRTILIYRGACHFMEERDIPWQELKKVKWFYLAPLSEKSAQLFASLVSFAKKNNIKIVANPGNSQINLGEDILEPILAKLDVLILNREEAALLTKIEKENEIEIIKKLTFLTSGLVVVTKGKQGSVIIDGKYIFEAETPLVLPVEKTGAGDAFGSGFLSGLLQKNNIEYAIQLATANATGCIQKIGAKNGLLKKGEWGSWPKLKVEKRSLAP